MADKTKQAAQPAAKKTEKPASVIGANRAGPRGDYEKAVAAIDKQLNTAEKDALETLRRCGWHVMVYAQIENAYMGSTVRSTRIRGRYDLALARKKIRR